MMCAGRTREPLHSWVSSSPTAIGVRRAIAGAFLLSLSIHVLLVGVLSQIAPIRPRTPVQQELHVDLSPKRSSTIEGSSTRAPSRPKLSTAERQIKGSSDR